MRRHLRFVLCVIAISAAAFELLWAQSGVIFETNWDTADGNSYEAVTDGGRWPDYWEFNSRGITLLSVVTGGVNGHNALKVQQRGSSFAANLQVDDFIAQSKDYYLRYYVRNDDTSNAGDHIVTADTFQYANLTFLRKYGGPRQWRAVVSLYGCGYTYPIGHWSAQRDLDNSAWYRFEYWVHYVTPTRVQLHPRVYDASGLLILNDDNFAQQDYGSAVWSGHDNWTLRAYYDAGQTFCVNPTWTNDFALGNNGQFGAADTGQSWYFAAVQIRTDGWPGPVDGSRGPYPEPPIIPPPVPIVSARFPGDAGVENDPGVIFAERFDEPTVAALTGRWSDVRGPSNLSFTDDAPQKSSVRRSLTMSPSASGDTHLTRQLPEIEGPMFLRYYVKYPGDRVDRASVSVGGNGNVIASLTNVPVWRDSWNCVEEMIKLNDPAGADGERAIWVNSRKITDSETGFQWRTDPELKLNWIGLFVDPAADGAFSAPVKISNLVIARQRIGCLPER